MLLRLGPLLEALGIAAVFAVGLPGSGVRAQSYPKLLTNGGGLALTKLGIQEQVGGRWGATPSLRPGAKYRLQARFTNFFQNVYSYGNHVRDVIRLSYEVQLPGATFYPTASYSGSGVAKFAQGYDPAGLGPTRSKSFYHYFTWSGPPMPLFNLSLQVTMTGSEVVDLARQSAPIKPSSP